MAKPRVFVSSTYYDLKHIRNNLEAFINQMGYEPVLFESGDIPFQNDIPLDESCYQEIENAHIQILIIGGRYGSKTSEKGHKSSVPKAGLEKQYEFYNSITVKEYHVARERNIPIFIFVEKGVYAEYQTYKHNKENNSINYAHVDNINIFKLIDEIISQRVGSYIKDFENFDDIQNWLKEQWAGLFADFLLKKSNQVNLKSLSSEIGELKGVTNALKEYSEIIMKKLIPATSKQIIAKEDRKILLSSARRFFNEPMIDFIIHKYVTTKFSPIQVFEKFLKSKSLKDFLVKLEVPKDGISKFLDAHEVKAVRDYRELKNDYSNTNDEE